LNSLVTITSADETHNRKLRMVP